MGSFDQKVIDAFHYRYPEVTLEQTGPNDATALGLMRAIQTGIAQSDVFIVDPAVVDFEGIMK